MFDNRNERESQGPRRRFVALAPVAIAVAALSVALPACGGDDGDSGEARETAATEKEKGKKADADVSALRETVATRMEQQRESAAKSVIDDAVADDKLTKAEGERLEWNLTATQEEKKEGKPPGDEIKGCEDVQDVQREFTEALAVRRQRIGGQLLEQAVEDKKITKQQADNLEKGFDQARKAAARGPAIDPCDKDVQKVIQEARKAYEDGGKGAAQKVLDQAVKDDEITSRQAKALEPRVTQERKQKRKKDAEGEGN